MSTNDIQTLVQKLNQYKADKALSYNQLANEIGSVSGATLSNICGGKIDQISEGMMRRILAFLKHDSWVTLSTTNYEIIQELAWEAQEFSRFFGIVGDSGFGKSEGLKQYQAKNPNCFYMMADILMGRGTAFLNALQRACGLEHKGCNASEMLGAIVHKLNSVERPLVVIDDAGKLSDTNMRILQLLYDRTERRCGIIIAGTPYLKLTLENGITRNKMGYNELYRRVEYWQVLFAPTVEEKRAFLEKYQLHENKAVANTIINTTKDFGSLRASINLCLRLKDKNRLTETALLQGFSKKEAA